MKSCTDWKRPPPAPHQLFFMVSILVVTVVLLTAIKGRNQIAGIGLTSLPAMFAKGTAMFS